MYSDRDEMYLVYLAGPGESASGVARLGRRVGCFGQDDSEGAVVPLESVEGVVFAAICLRVKVSYHGGHMGSLR